MLQLIRKKFTGGIAIAILALIGIPFLFFGVGNNFVIGQQFAAKVDGSEISATQFESYYRSQLNNNPTWAQLPEEFRVQIRQSILDAMIRERLVEMHLADVGYKISDEQLTKAIQRIPDFQVDNTFDMETYRSVLLQNNLDATQFEESQRRSLRMGQLQRAIGGSALVTPAEYRRYLNLIAEQRLVSMATFDIVSVAAEIEVGDDRVTAFYDDNDTMFLTQESVDIEIIEISRDDVAAGIEITEEALVQYYEDNSNRYLRDEQRQARHILVLFNDDESAAETKASELLARAQAGEPFEDLAREYSDDGGTSSSGGDLGALTRTQLPGELGGAIFAMGEGEVEGLIQSDFGFHIVKLDSILAQGPLPLDQVRGELLSELRDRDAESAFRDLQRRVSDALFDAADMQAISSVVGLDVQAATGFTRGGGEPIGSNQAAIDAVFDERVLTGGEISEVIEIDARRSAIFKVTDHYEASRQPLDDVRDQIVDTVRAQEAETIVLGGTEQLLAALAGGEDFGIAAEAAGAAVSSPSLLSRQNEQVDSTVLAEIFAAKKPTQSSPVTGRVPKVGGGYTVFSLGAVLPGRPESIPLADRDAGKRRLAETAGRSDYIAFVESLYDRADIVISQDVLAAQDLLQ